ncbi:hypothetical protein M2282_004783 [Variovorax boronicumulans]|uniref:hypothetical protein n=1 Tax=Variovorax boronicumulans TaxID=436515 RepID=UPI002474734B|nr:hypothetical protein [Variovorax boronicumulans]MDH6169615.1 hypothetical protein [Variovorax boronicumulans]
MVSKSFGTSQSRVSFFVLSACLAALAMPAFARDTRLVLPIFPVMQQPATRDAIGNDVQLRFAVVPQAKAPQAQMLTAQSYARPYSGTQRYADGRPVIRSDEETCREALRNTLVALVEAARARGVHTVTQVESFYDGAVLSTPNAYECHAGTGSAEVHLRGVAGGDAGAAAAASAAVDDIDAVPGLDAEGRAAYQKFLQNKPPRTLVLRQSGGSTWVHWADGLVPRDISRPSDPTQRAMEYCTERHQGECTVYAVDYTVVYQKPKAAAAERTAAAPGPAVSLYRLPTDSHFADVNDPSPVPVREKSKDRYLRFLALPMPRAFAIAADGSAAFASGSAAMADVLNTCEREGKTCWLYAVDDRVVWQADPHQRIGRVNQLSRVRQDARTP